MPVLDPEGEEEGRKSVMHLYRYPHPFTQGRWLYVGQGAKRDSAHRSGQSSFGRRFKRLSPNTPQPVRWQETASTRLDANLAETVTMPSMVPEHPGGMNLTLPGSQDYKNAGYMGGVVQGQRNAANGQMSRISHSGALTQPREAKVYGGRKASRIIKEKRAGIFSLTPSRKGGKIGGRSLVRLKAGVHAPGMTARGRCKRWQVDRGKPCICGRHRRVPV